MRLEDVEHFPVVAGRERKKQEEKILNEHAAICRYNDVVVVILSALIDDL